MEELIYIDVQLIVYMAGFVALLYAVPFIVSYVISRLFKMI